MCAACSRPCRDCGSRSFCREHCWHVGERVLCRRHFLIRSGLTAVLAIPALATAAVLVMSVARLIGVA
jgi:hypothetical protein